MMGAEVMFVMLTAIATMPRRATKYSAGIDLFSRITVEIPALGMGRIATGVRAIIPEGYYGKLEGLGGLANDFGYVIS